MRVRVHPTTPHLPLSLSLSPSVCLKKGRTCTLFPIGDSSTSLTLMLPAKTEELASLFPHAMALVSRTFDSFRSYLASFTWGPFIKLSRSTVLGLLSRIEIGQLVVRDSDGAVTICGQPGIKGASPRTELRVLKEAFWMRVMLFADMVSDLIFTTAAALVRRLRDRCES